MVAVLVLSILVGSSPPLFAQAGLCTVYVDGVKVAGYPVIKDGTAYLPTNVLAEALGVSIGWDPRLNVIKVNGQVVSTPPLNEQGRLFLPVEALANAVGASVEWDGRARVIRLTTGQNVAGGPRTPATPPATTTYRPTTPTVTVLPSTAPVAVPATPTATWPAAGTSTTITLPRTPPSSAPTVQVPSAPAGPPVGANPSGGFPTPNSQVSYPAASAYPAPDMRSQNMRPPSAQIKMPSGLELPPVQVEPGTPPGSTTQAPMGQVYVPKSAQNNVFAVTVTNIETVGSIKDFYHPKPGYRYVIVYLSQQNVSNEVQIYTGRFSLLDQNSRAYDYIEGLSNFWLVILRPYGINFGYLVFEVPVDAHPTRLALHALNQSPLTLNL